MTLSLRTRQFVAYALVMLAALAAATAIETRVQRRWLLERTRETLERDARQVGRLLLERSPARAGDLAGRGAGADSPPAAASRWSPETASSADSRADAATLENHADRPEIRAALAGREGSDVRHSRSLGLDLLYVAMPAAPGRPYAVVRVAEPLAIVRDLNASLLRLSLFAGLADAARDVRAALLAERPALLARACAGGGRGAGRRRRSGGARPRATRRRTGPAGLGAQSHVGRIARAA